MANEHNNGEVLNNNLEKIYEVKINDREVQDTLEFIFKEWDHKKENYKDWFKRIFYKEITF